MHLRQRRGTMNKFRAATVTATLAVTALGLPMATAGPAAAASVGKCVQATWHPSKNSVDIYNGCKKTIKVQIAERWWPDSDCFTIRPKGRLHYQGTGQLQGAKYC
ncbi:hypothetical protein SAMN05428945_4015 [Streptomyces sp. 2224.1]|nr:hypothetical protein BX261_1322 [Streptomyces sp. 2321.6]SDR54988.1 hypothetical protein SAMN05216511_5894 [Streptomyces sp. KS_16]SEC15613.1 hypothetical protein SAMN05428940_1322 [Streptomyces sp. 2133.1]SED15711.1 hypothetical protein SAMN05428945_4015 [Streptomyces sp. 2224.1]SEF07792.1 hypothetical protein SAMN05428954_5957 [Streptomyces sp. 2112.3]SNC65428.1 hypothetical protein SAMN06272741_1320 [Streptomyces sp. 2114.4]